MQKRQNFINYLKFFQELYKLNVEFSLDYNNAVNKIWPYYYRRCMVPPAPSVIAQIKSELDEIKKRDPNVNVAEFLKTVGIEPGYNPLGKDDPSRPKSESLRAGMIEMERID